MFESVKQGKESDGIAHVTSLMLSFVIHIGIICLLILVPMLCFTESRELLAFVIDAPLPPPPPDPPAPPAGPGGGDGTQGKAQGKIEQHIDPQNPPFGTYPEAPQGDDDANVDLRALAGGGGLVGRQGGTGLIPTVVQAFLKDPVEPPPPPLPPSSKREIVRLPYIDPSRLISQVDPVYPPLAITTRVSGRVILEAVIDEDGNVTNLTVLSGHPLLRNAAVEAVKQWKYSRTILNGEPVPVIATVTVIFTLK